jgi:hypothetical protein
LYVWELGVNLRAGREEFVDFWDGYQGWERKVREKESRKETGYG